MGLALAACVQPGFATAGALVAAHRGGAMLWPENSLTAVRGALALGVAFVETDVHLTADGEVVVIHDATLDRTTTGEGRVRARSMAELAGVRLRGRDGAPIEETVPSLDAVLALLAPGTARLLLEIKTDTDTARYPGIEAKVLDRLRARRMLDRTVVMAFDPETIVTVRALAPDVPTCLLIGMEQARAGDVVDRARAVRATHLGLYHRLVTRDVVAAARAGGLAVAAWTVDAEADIRRVLEAGVDVVVSDRPDVALRVAR